MVCRIHVMRRALGVVSRDDPGFVDEGEMEEGPVALQCCNRSIGWRGHSPTKSYSSILYKSSCWYWIQWPLYGVHPESIPPYLEKKKAKKGKEKKKGQFHLSHGIGCSPPASVIVSGSQSADP